MALRVLMLRKKLGEKQEALAELRKAAEGFSAREAELTKAIDEAGTPDEKAAVEEAIEQFLRAKCKCGAPDRAACKRLSDALLRRGFSWQDIRPALSRLGEELPED